MMHLQVAPVLSRFIVPEIVHDARAHWLVVEDDDAVVLPERPRRRLLAAHLVKHLRPSGRHRPDVADPLAKHLQILIEV